MVFDEDTAKRIEAVYQTHDAARRRRIVRDALGAASGERVLDVGCGPGFYCVELLEDVGRPGSVVGVDSSPSMLELAARRCATHDNVELREGDIVSLPVEDGGFDAALCIQVLEFVPDPTAGLAEMRRALRPGGRVVVWDIDWATVSLHSRHSARMDRVLRAWDEHLAHRSLPRTLGPRLRSAGFEDVRMEAHAFATIDFDPGAYYGAAMLSGVRTFVIGHDGITEELADAWLEEQRELGRRGEFFFTITQFCFTATKPR